jgi:hypothetical protein
VLSLINKAWRPQSTQSLTENNSTEHDLDNFGLFRWPRFMQASAQYSGSGSVGYVSFWALGLPDPLFRSPDPYPSIIKNDVLDLQKVISKKNRKNYFFVVVLMVTDENNRIRIRIRWSEVHTKMSRIRNTASTLPSSMCKCKAAMVFF